MFKKLMFTTALLISSTTSFAQGDIAVDIFKTKTDAENACQWDLKVMQSSLRSAFFYEKDQECSQTVKRVENDEYVIFVRNVLLWNNDVVLLPVVYNKALNESCVTFINSIRRHTMTPDSKIHRLLNYKTLTHCAKMKPDFDPEGKHLFGFYPPLNEAL